MCMSLNDVYQLYEADHDINTAFCVFSALPPLGEDSDKSLITGSDVAGTVLLSDTTWVGVMVDSGQCYSLPRVSLSVLSDVSESE